MTTTVADSQLSKIISDSGLSAPKQQVLLEALLPLWTRAADILKDSAAVVVTDATQVAVMRRACELRKSLMRCRTAAETVRKDMKAAIIVEGRTVDAVCNLLRSKTETEEARLKSQEEFAERQEAERLAKRTSERAAALKPYVSDLGLYAFADLDEDRFQNLLESVIHAHDAQVAREAKAKEDSRLAEIQRQEQAARDKAEAERLRADNAAKDRQLALERELAEAERREAEEKARKELQEVQETARKEREVLDAKHREEQSVAAQLLREEEDKLLLAEAEIKGKAEFERKSRQAGERAARRAAAAPDADKLMVYYAALAHVAKPECTTDAGVQAMTPIHAALRELLREIKAQAESLGE